MLTPTERKRQGYIHELIVTEENYVNDLQLVTEVRPAGGAGAGWGALAEGGEGSDSVKEGWVLIPSVRSFLRYGSIRTVHHRGASYPREDA